MTHIVLARKWRPRSFQEVVGQAPVVRALVNSLDQNRLHHAYLLTGTRGVGKTSIARLFAKCLNCQQGVSSTPCGTCQNCLSIDAGRFLDLLEVDAASRTKVEDTRDLLDNVQYAPTQGRYKVYLIDEVHMLSNHSFNALLKTLEEPPPHVKFLLATTDPQRLPITVLSRCLQFHLKNLSQEQIAKQLRFILEAEECRYEPAALTYLAQAAQGSMRDALSLTDQAIAYTNGDVTAQEVKTLLGATEPELLLSLLHHVADANAAAMLEEINTLAEMGVDFPHVLEALLSILHQLTLAQTLPGISLESQQEPEKIAALAQKLTAETLQLYYQIALMGRRDLPFASTPRAGFEMILLRMYAFAPQTLSIQTFLTPQKNPPAPSEKKPAALQPAPQAIRSPAAPRPPTPPAAENNIRTASETRAIVQEEKSLPSIPIPPVADENWGTLLTRLQLQGAAAIVASHCTLAQQTPTTIQLALDPHHAFLLNDTVKTQIHAAVERHFQKPVQVTISLGVADQETPAFVEKKEKAEKQEEAVRSLAVDAHLQALIEQFEGKVIPGSVRDKKEDL
jgi:DNA polymerase-3 subunit gamma/tau